jgi:hypothetical protein
MPDPRQSAALLPATQVRVTPTQRTYLLLLAERWHCSMSEAIRRLIDQALDTEPPVRSSDESPLQFEEPMPMRALLELADHENVEPDPEWVWHYGEGE